MNGVLTSLAVVALLPAMTGLPPANARRAMTVALCSGGLVSIPLGETLPDRATTPCCAKGCRTKRKRTFDRKQ